MTVYTVKSLILMTKIKKYKLKHKDIAKYFGYNSERSFNSSSSKSAMIEGIELIIQHVENQLIKELKK